MVRERVEDLGSAGANQVASILSGLRQTLSPVQQSWDEMPGSGEVRRAQSERGREIGDLSMAGLHIQAAPARLLARGRRVIQPGGSNTPLEGNPGGLSCSTFSGSSGRVDYRRRLEMNTQDSD